MRFSIIAATMNRPQAIVHLLESVSKQTFFPQEFILVDQSKNDDSKVIFESFAELIRPKGMVFKYIRQEKPSLVLARNTGFDASTGDIICFVDDDVILYDDYFEKIAFYFRDPAIGGISGNVVVSEELKGFKWFLRRTLMNVFLLSHYDGRLTLSTFGYPVYEREVTKTMKVDLFSGYSMNFRRHLVERNRPDVWFSGYSFREDVDLSYRISREATLVMVPDARFIHDASNVGRLDTFNLKKMQFKNYYYLFLKFRKYGIFSWVLFFYSLSGIVIMDFIEFLMGFRRNKWDAFVANFPAFAQMGDIKREKN